MEIRIKWHENLSYEEKALSLVEYDVFQLSLRYNIAGFTPEDIAQELRLALWKYIPTYQPKKSGIRTFANLVMRRRLYNLMRDGNRDKRKIHYNLCELNDDISKTVNIIVDEEN